MIDENEAHDVDETHDQPKHDPNMLPAKRVVGKPFGEDNQPSSEAKKAGWLRKKRNKELAQYILGRSWKENRMNKDMHAQMKEFFGLGDDELEELTYEAVIMMKQVAMAIKNGDNTAAQQLFERAFGKPMQTIGITDDGTPPQINITIQQVTGVTPIAENESDVDTTMPERQEGDEA
jgi:hypothetical protein